MWTNEIDPFPAAWQRALMAERHLPDGHVDERSIADIHPADLAGLRELHFFAGIGVWPLALRLAGWPFDRGSVWTGSCPCQPFSGAGKGRGFADERHLWPLWFHLIEHCEPECILGEQVEGKDGRAWLDLVFADLEGLGYACGAVVAPAAGFGAPHQRHRLYWVAHAGRERREHLGFDVGAAARGDEGAAGERERLRPDDRAGGDAGRVADAASARHLGQVGEPEGQARDEARVLLPGAEREAGGLDDADARRCGPGGISRMGRSLGSGRDAANLPSAAPDAGPHERRPCPTNGLWGAADWLLCRDEKWRPVEPGTFPLADAGAVRNRVGALRGAGNALALAQAVAFVEAVMEAA